MNQIAKNMQDGFAMYYSIFVYYKWLQFFCLERKNELIIEIIAYQSNISILSTWRNMLF